MSIDEVRVPGSIPSRERFRRSSPANSPSVGQHPDVPDVRVIRGDCLEVLKRENDGSIDIVVTSPPYNLGIGYALYKDNKNRDVYLSWLNAVFAEIKRVMKDNGSFFLNMGASNTDPWVPYDVANEARKLFVLQNDIVWVKSITIGDTSSGHFKPINSDRFLNHTHESIFHLTKTGNVKVDRLAIGVHYQDKGNIKRWNRSGRDIRCRGNSWYVPYETIRSRGDKGMHPAVFPEQLVENCIRLHGFRRGETVVCDPFCGTGTTMVVAARLGLRGLTMEIDQSYIEYMKRRIRQAVHS